VSFDCWLGEVGGSGRADQSTGCKETFMEQLAKVEARQLDLPDMYSVFFETGSALLSVPARNTITDAVRAADLLEADAIEVVGFADGAGSAQANEALANDRALAVVEALLQAGVPAEVVETATSGTAGGAGDAHNRRADITLIR
jgi:OOP family OmpA-OmpF porin